MQHSYSEVVHSIGITETQRNTAKFWSPPGLSIHSPCISLQQGQLHGGEHTLIPAILFQTCR